MQYHKAEVECPWCGKTLATVGHKTELQAKNRAIDMFRAHALTHKTS